MARNLGAKVSLGLAALLAVTALGGCGPAAVQKTTGSAKTPYVLGMVTAETGGYASLGVPEANSAQMAIKAINQAGGVNGHPVQLDILDSKSDSNTAAMDFTQLIKDDHVIGLIGDSSTQGTMAGLQVVSDSQIPLVSMASAKEIIQPPAQRRWIFKVPAVDTLPMQVIANYLTDKGIKRVAFVYMNAEYGTAGLADFQPVAAAAGIKIVDTEAFDPSATTIVPQLTALKAKNPAPQAVVVWAIPPAGDTVIKDYRSMNLSWPILFSDGMSNQAFIQLAPQQVNGAFLASTKLLVADQLPATDPQKNVLQNYISSYNRLYEASSHAPANMFGGFGYDAVQLYLKALASAGAQPTPTTVRNALEHLDYAGVTGHMKLQPTDHNGLTKDSEVLIQVQNDKWQLVPKYHG